MTISESDYYGALDRLSSLLSVSAFAYRKVPYLLILVTGTLLQYCTPYDMNTALYDGPP